MANSPQARKRARQQTKRRLQNMSQRSAMRSSIKKLLKLIADKNEEGAKVAYKDAVSSIDKLALRGLHHRNRASRLKSRLNSRLRAIDA